MDNISKLIKLSNDYNELLFDQVLGTNTYSIDSTTGILTVVDNSATARGYARLYLGKINPGALIEVSGWVKQNAVGSSARVWIERSGTANFTGGGTTYIVQPTNEEWEFFKIQQPMIQGTNYAQVGIGAFTADTGDISVKDVTVKVFNANTQLNLKRAYGCIRRTTAGGVWEFDTRFPTSNGLSFSVSSTAITINYPNMDITKPLFFLTLDYFADGADHRVLAEIPQSTTTNIRIIDVSTNTAIDPQAFTGEIYIGFMVHGGTVI